MRHHFPVATKDRAEWHGQEDIMSDLNGSLYTLFARHWWAEKAQGRKELPVREEEAGASVTESERRLPEREESFYWAWQYPGHW